MGREKDAESLLEAWEETDQDSVRIAVLQALASLPACEAGRRLVVRQAVSNPCVDVRLEAVRALGRQEGEGVVDALIEALADPYPSVREVARAGLAGKSRLAHPALLAGAAGHANHLARASAIELLVSAARSNPDLASGLLEILSQSARTDDAPGVREAAVAGLGKLGAGGARLLLRELERSDPDAGVRMSAARSLRRLGKPPAAGMPVVAVLPLKNDTGLGDPAIGRFCEQMADYLAARLSESGVCKVVDRSRMEQARDEMRKIGQRMYDGNTPNAPSLGYFKMANQLVYGSLQRNDLAYTIVLNRMRVETLEMIPGAAATVSGYRADLEQLKVKVADRFITNFQP